MSAELHALPTPPADPALRASRILAIVAELPKEWRQAVAARLVQLYPAPTEPEET
jgi:hypothetical protein